MTRKAPKNGPIPSALPALQRAAKYALELAIQTNTPCWIMDGDKIVDATKSARNKKKKARRKSGDTT